jgi:hypothetical protein
MYVSTYNYELLGRCNAFTIPVHIRRTNQESGRTQTQHRPALIAWPTIHQIKNLRRDHQITRIYGRGYRRGMDWILDLLTTCTHHSELHFTDQWHTQTSVLSLLQSPLSVSWQRLHRCPCRILDNWQVNYLVPRLADISHQAPNLLFTGWLSTDNWPFSLTSQLLHVTSLNWIADKSNCSSAGALVI